MSIAQYGFQPNRSTEHAILELQDRIMKIMTNKKCCVGVFMDLSKAFDTLDHKILLDKLEHYGIRGIAHDWFRNYLTNRKQYVNINGTSSGQLPITCGVPQGSILGPLLFLIYVNDLANVSKNAITILFADDTNTIYEGTSYDELMITVQDDLKDISNWFKTNKLALNETKTKFMIFHTRFNKPPDSFKIVLNNVDLERVDNTKFLGVLIQENLGWKTHIDYICDRVSRATSILARLKHYLPKSALLLIYNSLCISHMMYAISVWGEAPKSNIDRMIKLQKKGLRHVTNSKYNAHTEPLFKLEKMLQLHDLFKLQCVKLVHKKCHKKLHSYHTSKLLTNYEITGINTRCGNDVHINEPENSLTRVNSINFKIGMYWNELNSEIKEKAFRISISTFTKHVKNDYISRYSEVCNKESCYICENQ